jgi:hypothetical protein
MVASHGFITRRGHEVTTAIHGVTADPSERII